MGRVSPLVQIVLLALWLGSALFLSAVVAPALFAVLPSRTLAGAVVGRILPVVFYAGMAIGAIVVALQFTAPRANAWQIRGVAGTLMVAACAVAQFVVGPRIERLRATVGRPIEELAAGDAQRVAFGRLHGFSVAWLGLAMLAALVAVIVAARSLPLDNGR
jgi:hypothetical protein